MPAANEGFGVRRGVVSWDTSQEFGSSPPVRAFVKPRPTPSPRHVGCKCGTVRCETEQKTPCDNEARPVKPLEQGKTF